MNVNKMEPARLESCGNCHWWSPETPGLALSQEPHGGVTGTGACHVMPPAILQTDIGPCGFFPVTHRSRYCQGWTGRRPIEAEGNVVPFAPTQGAA